MSSRAIAGRTITMAKIDTYLFFDGTCAEAMRFYEKVLGGKLQALMQYKDGPPGACAAGAEDRVMHAALVVGDRMLMASDTVPKFGHDGNKGFAVSLMFDTAAEAQRAFDALADGGKVEMPLAASFFMETFGTLTDRFGIPWMIGGGAAT